MRLPWIEVRWEAPVTALDGEFIPNAFNGPMWRELVLVVGLVRKIRL